jgi:diacylglycerol kinase family enzyme
MRKILLFINPLLQRTRARRRDLANVASTFREAGIAVDSIETGPNRAAGQQAKQALAEDHDAVVVCGGDGTIFDVIQGMAGSHVPLGIVPFGTGNVLAQNLKIPTDPTAAAQALLTSRSLSAGLGQITCGVGETKQTWLFAMSAGMGMHAALMYEARRSGKDVTGKAAYFAAGGRMLLHYPLQSFEIEVETTTGSIFHEEVSEALALRVAELNLWRTGGGLTFPHLRLASVPGGSRARLARAAYEALFRSSRAQKEGAAATYRDVLRVICRPTANRDYKPAISVQADGEVLGNSYAEIQMSTKTLLLLSPVTKKLSLQQ